MKSGDEIGPYRVIRLLGRGGMGMVYEVEHRDLGVRYALKVFTCERSTNAFLRKRFLTEGKLLARLNHPRIVKVFDLSVDSRRGVPYFVMNLVLSPDGKPRTLEELRKAGGISETQALAWYTDLAEGLSYVHANGVVHRDVKLENVLVDAEGHAVLSDFGVSRIFEEKLRRDLRTTVTLVGFPGGDDRLIMGTKAYLSPEIRFGEKATPPSDWYALGVLMLRLLTGMWYGPETDLEGLLAGFENDWSSRLVPLLAIDPVRRHPFLPRKGVRVQKGGARRQTWLQAASAAVAAVGLAVLGYLEFFKTAPEQEEREPLIAAVPEPAPRPDEPVPVASPAASAGVPAASETRVETPAPQVPLSPDRPAQDTLASNEPDEGPSAVVWNGSPEIPRYAFAGRTGLEAVAIPEGVTTIGEGAFVGTGLRAVSLPSTLVSIDRLAFSACDKLDQVVFNGPPPEVDAVTQTFPVGADGSYPAAWAPQWQSVIDPETGMWMGLLMYQDGFEPR